MSTTTARLGTIVLAVAMAAGCLALTAGATTPLPTPGSTAQVASAVGASTSIRILPHALVPALPDVHLDDSWEYYRKLRWPDCPLITSCVLGDTTSNRVIVLFGDSHAFMWLPAVNPIAKRDGFKLILFWTTDCPAASVTYWDPTAKAYSESCDEWRSSALSAIRSLDPSVVLLASMTANRDRTPTTLFTNAQWEAGLVKTIDVLKAPGTKIAVIGDIPTFNVTLPTCLAAFPASVQACGVAERNPVTRHRGHQQAEIAASKRTGVLYVSTLRWLCASSWCSPVVGRLVVYVNSWHVTATYAYYLTRVLGVALRPVL